jgi:molybdopterin synthase sulfur carrier subunit
MDLTFRFFATFRQAVGSKSIDREFDDDTTVGDALAALENEFSGLEGQLLNDEELQPHINVLKNGREVFHMDREGTEVDDGDTISVFPPVAGG